MAVDPYIEQYKSNSKYLIVEARLASGSVDTNNLIANNAQVQNDNDSSCAHGVQFQDRINVFLPPTIFIVACLGVFLKLMYNQYVERGEWNSNIYRKPASPEFVGHEKISDYNKVVDPAKISNIAQKAHITTEPSGKDEIRYSGPSFACEGVKQPFAVLVCSDKVLSTMENEVAILYVNIRDSGTWQDKREIIDNQLNWNARTAEVCNIPESGIVTENEFPNFLQCLQERYKKRVNDFQKLTWRDAGALPEYYQSNETRTDAQRKLLNLGLLMVKRIVSSGRSFALP